MLQGDPAARKSSAIKTGTRLLEGTGYTRFASDRMSRQSFLDELYRINQPENMGYTEEELWDLPMDGNYPYEMTIHAREFIDFIGQNDKDYLSLITNLYDNLPQYSNPKLSSKNVLVKKPTINFIGAATQENLNMAFPTNAMDTGTLSRILFIYSSPVTEKILLPDRPSEEARLLMIARLKEIGEKVKGKMTLSPEGYEALKHIYTESKPLEDARFTYYYGRRLGHLLKLCIVHAAARLSTTISIEDVLTANTVLGAAEYNMPRALGHFGRAKQSIIMHSILDYIERQGRPVEVKELYTVFVSDFNKENEFSQMLMDMQNSHKVKGGYVGSEHASKLAFTVEKPALPKWLQLVLVEEALTVNEREAIGLIK